MRAIQSFSQPLSQKQSWDINTKENKTEPQKLLGLCFTLRQICNKDL